MNIKTLIVGAAVTAISINAFGWGRKGHTIVAHIAETHLTAEARVGMRADLCGEILSDIANWGDEIHNDPKYVNVIPLHYVQIKDGAKTYQESQPNPQGDLVVATQALLAYLKTGDENALSKVEALKSIGRQAAVKLLVHFYGDLHQPLHVSNTDDMGGNTIKVESFGRHSNLHAVWDQGMLEGRSEFDGLHYANHLSRHFKNEDQSQWQNENILDWANYSLSIFDEISQFPDSQVERQQGNSQSLPNPSGPASGNGPQGTALPVVSYRYTDKNAPIMDKQLWLAGMRLAYALNEIYKPNKK